MNSYNLNGNTTRIASTANAEAIFATTMNYDTLNRCTEINSPGGVETMAYRGSEWHRYSVTAGGVTTNFLYDGDNVVADLQSSAIVRMYSTPFLDQNLAMYNVSGETITPYYYAQDGLGSVRTLTDSNEVLKNAYDYYAFGGAYAPGTVQGVEQRYTYTGRETTQDPNLMYYRWRMYAPEVVRLGQRDPLGYFAKSPKGTIEIFISSNLYAYVDNSPQLYSDPFGTTKRSCEECLPFHKSCICIVAAAEAEDLASKGVYGAGKTIIVAAILRGLAQGALGGGKAGAIAAAAGALVGAYGTYTEIAAIMELHWAEAESCQIAYDRCLKDCCDNPCILPNPAPPCR